MGRSAAKLPPQEEPNRRPGAVPNIPAKSNRNLRPCFSNTLYRELNRAERFSKLKHFRRIATRYDKLADKFLAMVQLASMWLWLRAYEPTAWCGALERSTILRQHCWAAEGDVAGDIEAMGALTTAGLAGSVIDGPARRGVKRQPAHVEHNGACANCGTVLAGDFCHACGQAAHIHRSIGHIFEEFLHGIWHFDSKAWRTLPRLAFAPGRLTREYVHGKRAGYIAPLGLFLFTIFLMFFVFGFVGASSDYDAGKDRLTVAREAAKDARADAADAQADLTAATDDSDAAKVRRRLAKYVAKQQAADAELSRVEALPAAERTAKVTPRKWKDDLAKGVATGKLKVNTGVAEIDANIRKALENPDFALYKVEQKAYKLSFLLVPLSLPVLWLMFAFRRDVHTYDHVVFALYSLSFMSLLFIIIVLFGKVEVSMYGVLTNGVGSLLIFAIPVHMFAQLRGAYALDFGGALWRTVVLTIASMLTLALFVVMIVVVGLAD